MAIRIPLITSCVLLLSATVVAEEPQASRQKFKFKNVQAGDAVKVIQAVDETRNAAAQTVVRAQVYRGPTVEVREEVDPQDLNERFLLLLSGGPVVVDVAMTIDGKPFRIPREMLIGEMLAAADKNDDGKVTLNEASRSSRFKTNRTRLVNGQQPEQLLKPFDRNSDGLIDRGEARRFVANYFQGPAFALSGSSGNATASRNGTVLLSAGGNAYRGGGGQADLRKLLDADSDGELSEKEIAASAERLKSRDLDDNDLLLPSEINGTPATNNGRVRRFVRQPRQAQQPLAVLLGPTAEAEALFRALQQRYKNDAGEIVTDSFATVPTLFKALDKDDDGKLQRDEVLGLNGVAPHLQLGVNLGKDANGLTLKSLAEEFSKTKESGQSLSVELPGVKLSFTANLNLPRAFDYSRAANSYLSRFDKDNNEYLDEEELTGNLARLFEMWDEDEDGKVYAKEITASYARMQAPQQTQIRCTTANQGNSLFQALDLSGDSRLSLREMRSASRRIREFDTNKDGRIASAEIPPTISVAFRLGNAGYGSGRLASRPGRPAANRPTSPDTPHWFTRMDRNGDGDVTLKEFLGGEEQFRKLDTNGDSFIEPGEAKAAEDEGS